MVPEASKSADKFADKFIVDRTKPHRNSNVGLAVRRTRDRLSQNLGPPDFNRDMLKLHARAILSNAIKPPLLIVSICVGGLYAGFDAQRIFTWAFACLACYLPLFALAHRLNRLPENEIEVTRTRYRLYAAHFASGLGWAYFAILPAPAGALTDPAVIQGAVLLFVIAGTAIVTASLGGALVAAFALPVCLFAFTVSAEPDTASMVTALVLAASLPFLAYVAHHRNRAALRLLAFESEKNALIGELETAKSMSDEARRRAEEANLAKSRFLASMSHELRTPLNAILGFSEVMANQVLGPLDNPTYRDYANDIHTSGKHLLSLINEILDLSRIEAGRYRLNEEPLLLGPIVEDCCRLMEMKARGKGISLRLEVEPTLLRLFADERAIRQITLNLLANAVKFSPTGSEVRIRVGWTAGGGQYLAIKDNGPGIPDDELAVVLSAFGQGSIAIKSAEQGTGLGLPIVQGLTALHDGVFELNSRLRSGTDAIVAFPRSRVMEELPAVPRERKRASGGAA
ncbi:MULTISPECIES: HAMP domain-containing sensor histidine kinase [unclassified Nitratireductor]|uniref:sensor histidine kinase n=1 Tax=unclassified Nitratireductor TaxID=2641084 RepID=UPI0024BE1E71|nr:MULTISPECIES: HAMP domain-containing sensor histidine kinase [unclassified Nitratireductor]MCV0377801.1 HAMP domain-containing histidine kinase [Nitratireductor sp.]MDJ1464701.1 HAMP domain-containing histidine kinase [Nitratireductor sp. GZWM139]